MGEQWRPQITGWRGKRWGNDTTTLFCSKDNCPAAIGEYGRRAVRRGGGAEYSEREVLLWKHNRKKKGQRGEMIRTGTGGRGGNITINVRIKIYIVQHSYMQHPSDKHTHTLARRPLPLTTVGQRDLDDSLTQLWGPRRALLRWCYRTQPMLWNWTGRW